MDRENKAPDAGRDQSSRPKTVETFREELKEKLTERLSEFPLTSSDVIRSLRNVSSNPGEQRAPVDYDRALNRTEQMRLENAMLSAREIKDVDFYQEKYPDSEVLAGWLSDGPMGIERNPEVIKARDARTVVESWAHLDTYRGELKSPTENAVRSILMRKAAEYFTAYAQRKIENKGQGIHEYFWPATVQEFADAVAVALRVAGIAEHDDRHSYHRAATDVADFATHLQVFVNDGWKTGISSSLDLEMRIWQAQVVSALASNEIGRMFLPENIEEILRENVGVAIKSEDGVYRRERAEYGFARQIDVDILQGQMLKKEIHEALDAVKPILEKETRAKASEAIREKRKQLEKFGQLAREYQEFLHGENGLFTLQNRSAIEAAEFNAINRGWFGASKTQIKEFKNRREEDNKLFVRLNAEYKEWPKRFEEFAPLISDPESTAMYWTDVDTYVGGSARSTSDSDEDKPLKREKPARRTSSDERLAALRAAAKNAE